MQKLSGANILRKQVETSNEGTSKRYIMREMEYEEAIGPCQESRGQEDINIEGSADLGLEDRQGSQMKESEIISKIGPQPDGQQGMCRKVDDMVLDQRMRKGEEEPQRPEALNTPGGLKPM